MVTQPWTDNSMYFDFIRRLSILHTAGADPEFFEGGCEGLRMRIYSFGRGQGDATALATYHNYARICARMECARGFASLARLHGTALLPAARGFGVGASRLLWVDTH